MTLLARLITFAVGWLASDPEPSDQPHENAYSMACDGVMPDGEACAPCAHCEHPACRHLNDLCLDCDQEDGVCRS